MFSSFPKIFALGTNYIRDIFKHEIEITEKVDGSQFGFGKVDGELLIRSKGRQIFQEAVDNMFKKAVETVLAFEDIIPNNTVFYSEYLQKPKHNTLRYERIPKNHLVLFGMMRDFSFVKDYSELVKMADMLGIDVVPLIYKGIIEKAEDVLQFMDNESYLGGTKIEGVVVKNYHNPFLLDGQPIPLMAGKFVSEKFKERNHSNWKASSGKGKWELFKDGFRTEARWLKIVQHLRDNGELENAPRDIGKLMKALQNDIKEEDKETIKDFLWKEFGTEVFRTGGAGFPEWYKEYLLKDRKP